MAGFQAITGELALAPDPVDPPDLLLPRIRRGLAEVPVPRRRRASLVAVAAGVIALVALGGLSLSLGSRMSKAERTRSQLLDVLGALQQPGTNPVNLRAQGQASPGMVEVSGPGLERMYIVGQGVPQPAPGHAYQLWLGSGATFVSVGSMFVPDEGLVFISLTFDPSPYDQILITEESLGSHPSAPSQGGHVWQASF
jgi:hypothetical protein